ncbi:hypothetical protein BDR03DRAFT_986553 [Suillus americanus]|nr:hypothetical protein BDR03DRAFT_986553 [Suillus americanus]
MTYSTLKCRTSHNLTPTKSSKRMRLCSPSVECTTPLKEPLYRSAYSPEPEANEQECAFDLRQRVQQLERYIAELEEDRIWDQEILREMTNRHWDELSQMHREHADEVHGYQAQIDDLKDTVHYQATMHNFMRDDVQRLELDMSDQKQESDDLGKRMIEHHRQRVHDMRSVKDRIIHLIENADIK